jgi:hypothetical protein
MIIYVFLVIHTISSIMCLYNMAFLIENSHTVICIEPLYYILLTHTYTTFYTIHMYIYYATFYFSLYYYRNDYFHIL